MFLWILVLQEKDALNNTVRRTKMGGLHWMCFNCTDFIVPWRTRASRWIRERRGPIIVVVVMMMIFFLLLLSGSNLGEMLPWNKKMYNPKVTWKLKKRDTDVVDLVSCGAVRSRKLIRVEHSETRWDGLPDAHHLQGFCWFVSFVFEFFHENWISLYFFDLNEVFIVVNC